MNKSYGNYDDDFQEDYGMDDDYQDGRDYSNEYISYPENNRYNNAYGNYRGGYDRSNQGPPLGFGPMGPMGPPGFPGPPGPPGPPFSTPGDNRWRRGYAGPPAKNMHRGGPKNDKIIKYLLRCGIPREHVVNLPSDLLSMMEPMNCGLCAVKFESLDLSHIHYASRNHLKNQKKWITQRNTSSFNREPLKSRELYCELCDVHITSTEHADSHYAGKPHRSIVEGRKKPRNPFLLQPNRQGRLKALIRREMKFIKKTESTATAKKTKDKPKPGELFCEICQTSMMCSEQMTTHLNGKKHLSKEKQHILKLMKGELPDNTQKNTSKDNAGDNAEKGEEMEDEDEEKVDDGDEVENEGKGKGDEAKDTAGAEDDDWGEGGEDWKPSAADY